ncbi:LacI family DNA-binding transcriptional regulator [Granulicella mallensis]|uniref:Transcriptional regulator, LacI family n=1 Tax=Granulicella mallensis (strain ATCC BAA-1857 / DSM 23137 / MP5ACTX8) TaxID=682795 RepID=G8NQI8_GRAMM|nr:LacI family DNA-binding transcriptional regulator [Granulicella mallensis]AEU37214.1 transcriptional regulator, LacI family [Granulicella mallensis MP5ACTX8]
MKRSQSTPKSEAARKIDIRGVAAKARVSIATVSRTINHVPTVDPVLAARVWSAVAELNYFPNTQARALVSGKSKLLGLIVSEITNPFFPELIQEFEQVAVERGYEILIGSTNYEKKTIEQCARRMLERKVDGVAVMTFGIEEVLFERFAVDNIPVVFIDAAPSRPLSSVLAVDYRTGIYEGVQHLAVLGHRKIGFITGPLRLRSAEARKAAFLDCLRSTGLKADPAWIIEGDHTLDGGRDAMQKILALPQWPTAIMCSNDMTAIGVQHALFEAKLKVPDDFSLVGFDDIHLAEYTIPPLTTVRMSCKDLALRAVNDLLSHLQDSPAKPEAPSKIITRLIVRQTTGLPKDALADLPGKSTRKKSRE